MEKTKKERGDNRSAATGEVPAKILTSRGAIEWFWETDTGHRFSYVSTLSGFRAGLRIPDIIGRKRDELAEDTDDPKWAVHTADLKARRPFRGFEYSLRALDGSLRTISVSGEPRFDEAGRFIGYRGAASDITERCKLEEELHRARELFQAVLDHAPFGIVLKDTEGRYLEVSREWQRRYGMARDEVVGKTAAEVMPSELAEDYDSVGAQVMREGREMVREERLDCPEGNTEYYLTTRFPTLDRQGNVSGIGLISADITDRKMAEFAYEESEHQARAIAENLPVLMARFDRDWRYRFINREGARWYGKLADEVVGKQFGDLFSKETVDDIRPAVEKALSGERAFFSGSMDYPDGRTRKIEITFVPDVGPHGNVEGWFALAHDLTEREKAIEALRESEAQMRTVADNLPVFIAHIDGDMRYRFVNSTVEEWYGRPAAEILGRRMQELLPAETYKQVLPHLQTVLAGGQVGFESELQYPDGKIRSVDVAWIPDVDESGAVCGWFSLVSDISERRRLESQLLMRERLAALGQLTGTVAHELRNPLGAVAASIAALRRKNVVAKIDMERSLKRAERGIARCDRIITELLDFARARGLQREPVAFADWLTGVLSEQDLPEAITVAVALSACDAEVMIDQEYMRRAVINVLDNACQAVLGKYGDSNDDRGRIDIECWSGENRLYCDIRDNGVGIPAHEIDRVMEPLYSTKSFGTGLGLPTVQRIMEEHGGGIQVASGGGGTLARLWLPLDG